MDCFIVFSGISTNLEAFAKDLTTNDVNHMEAWNQQNSKENCTGVKWGKKLVKIFGKLGKAYVHYDMTWLEKSFYEGLEEWGLKCGEGQKWVDVLCTWPLHFWQIELAIFEYTYQ